METTNDILREMRDLGRLDEKSTDKIPRSLQALGLRTYADRLEAAIKREIEDAIAATVVATAKSASEVYEPHIQSEPVGNAAKMCEALKKADAALRLIHKPAWFLDFGENIVVEEADNAIKAALSAPPRNCDLYKTLDDARNTFFADYVPNETWSSATAFAIWLFAEAKGE